MSALVLHPKFDEASMHYDAALLFLTQPLDGGRTVSMATSSPRAGTTVSAAGWGKTREGASTTPGQLRSVVLEVGTTSACSRGNTSFGRYFAPSMLCASKPGRDTCSGDSGGPLVGTSGGHATLVGITSFGDGCARTRSPGRLHAGHGNPGLGALAAEARRLDCCPDRVEGQAERKHARCLRRG